MPGHDPGRQSGRGPCPGSVSAGNVNLPLLETLSEVQQKAWFYRTIKNMYLDQIRHSRYETAVEAIPETLSVIEEYNQIDLEQLLNSLPGKEGVLFVMRYLKAIIQKKSATFSICLRVRSGHSLLWPESI